jgi:GxxExxY protein
VVLVNGSENVSTFSFVSNVVVSNTPFILIDVAFKLHTEVGPGLLESAYEAALAHDLIENELLVETQVPVPFVYKDVKLEVGYRIDILLNKIVVLEIKSVEQLAPVHFAQTLTYLKLADKKLGLLINFNNKHLKDGIHRIVNNL